MCLKIYVEDPSRMIDSRDGCEGKVKKSSPLLYTTAWEKDEANNEFQMFTVKSSGNGLR